MKSVQYVSWCNFPSPSCTKTSVLNTWINRALRISDEDICDEEKLHLKSALSRNGYSLRGVHKAFKKQMSWINMVQPISNYQSGHLHFPSMKHCRATSELYEHPIFGKTLSRSRFEGILRCLCFYNAEIDWTLDKLHKIKIFPETFAGQFQESLHPLEISYL